jgi:hypothetical protein
MMRRFKPIPLTMLFVMLAGCLQVYGQTQVQSGRGGSIPTGPRNCVVRNTNQLPSTGHTTVAAITIPNLSGAYTSDASAIYYMEHTNSTLWWAGMSVDPALPLEQQWHRGLQFTNVFRGTVYCDGTILGQWADVTRGVNLGSGTLTLSICTTCQPMQIKQLASTGGFGGNTWWFRGAIDDRIVDYSSRTPMDINTRFGQVYKDEAANNWADTPQTLADNLAPYRDQTVVYGWISTSAHTCDNPPCYPGVGYTADWGNRDRDFESFMRTGHGSSNISQDADLDFNLKIDTAMMERDFYATGWGNNDHHVIYGRLDQYPGEPSIHIESIMYGWQGSVASSPGLRLLPGWADTSSNSVLINGRPVNGSVPSPSPTSSCKFIQPCPYEYPAGNKGLLFRDHKIMGSLGGSSSGGPANQTYVRVTGTLVLDCGHSPGGCDDDQNQEIHPVYSIDVIEHPFRPEDSTLRARPSLTGTWGGIADGSTYYLRHIGNRIWGLAQIRGRAPMQLGGNYAAIGALELTPAFSKQDPPCYSSPFQCAPFAIVFEGDVTERPDGSATVTGAWGGVPQSTTEGSSGGTIALLVNANRKVIALTGSPAIFPERLVKLYEPEDTVPPQSRIATVDAPVPAVSPAGPGRGVVGGAVHAKNVTITATDTGSGVQGIWYRHYTGPGQPPPFTFAAGPAVSFTLSGTAGSYSVDYYATDNAGNDEARKHAIVSFQVLRP